MNNKEFLVEAIDSCAYYTEARRKLLKIFINISVDDVSIISVVELSKLTKLTKASIYKAIKIFKADGIIESTKTNNISCSKRSNIYKINSSKLDLIVRHHLIKQNLLQK